MGCPGKADGQRRQSGTSNDQGELSTMRIAQIAPLQTATPPQTYGGTERVIHNLTESLVQLGHKVTLFATGDSQTSARLIPGLAEAVNFDPDIEVNAYHTAMLEDVYRHADDFDVIHSHLDYSTLPFIGTSKTPTVLTLHGRVGYQELRRVYEPTPTPTI